MKLRVLAGSRSGETILLGPAPLVLGRGLEAQVRFDDPSMSRVHAEVVPEGQDRWVLKNRSQHGSKVGGVRVETHVLAPGDELLLGETRLRVEAPPAPAEEFFEPKAVTPGGAAPGAVAPEGAGYDAQGVFHMGYTLMSPALAGDAQASAVILPALTPSGKSVRVPKRTLYFFLIVLVAALTGSAGLFVLLIRPMIEKTPGSFVLGSILALGPGIPYLVAYKLLDRNAQIPLRNYLSCFLWGATVGCGASLILNSITGEVFAILTGQKGGAFLTVVFAAPLFEETTKGLAVLVVFFVLRDEFDNAVEGLILGAASGLGFALVENCVYDTGFLAGGMSLGDFLWNGTYRALTCALVGHPVYTAMTGLGFGLARERRSTSVLRYFLPVMGWALAVAMHAGWNLSTIVVPRLMGGQSLLSEIVLGVLVGGGCATFFFLALSYGLAKERGILLQYLADEVAKGFIEPAELQSFRSLFGRERYVFAGLGNGTYSLRKKLRRAQLELAFRKWHLEKGDVVRGTGVDRVLLDARTRIRDARNAINAREGLLRAVSP